MENSMTISQERLTAVAVEIHTIQTQTRATVLSAACEIGKRLIEVKNGLPHGAFYDWLEENVDCSKRQAQNMMSLYEEYGRGDHAQTFADLSVSKAIALLAAPEEMREELVKDGTAEELSVRQLRDEIQRQKEELIGKQETIAELVKRAEDAEKLKGVYEKSARDAEKARADFEKDLEKVNREEQEASQRYDEAELARLKLTEELENARKELENARNAPPAEKIVEIEVVPPETEAELERLREIARKAPDEAVIKARAAYERAVREFEALIGLVRGMDEGNRTKYAVAFASALETMVRKMREAGKSDV